MKLTGVELRRISMPLVAPFRTSFGTETTRDIAAIRVADPALALRWRIAVREVLSGLVADGGRIDGFDRSGHYVVRRDW